MDGTSMSVAERHGFVSAMNWQPHYVHVETESGALILRLSQQQVAACPRRFIIGANDVSGWVVMWKFVQENHAADAQRVAAMGPHRA
jgi:hypothetical protein